MGQILHGSAKTTHAVRAAIQRSKASIKELAGRYDLNPKTVTKWRKRPFVHDAAMGPKAPHSTVLSAEEEALAVAFRKHTLLPLDDCLYATQSATSTSTSPKCAPEKANSICSLLSIELRSLRSRNSMSRRTGTPRPHS